MLPDIEPPPVWTPVTSWGHPRVWLRESVKAFSAWLNKPTKAEREDTDAYCEAIRAWSDRACGVFSKQMQQLQRGEEMFSLDAAEVSRRAKEMLRSSSEAPLAMSPESVGSPPQGSEEGTE